MLPQGISGKYLEYARGLRLHSKGTKNSIIFNEKHCQYIKEI